MTDDFEYYELLNAYEESQAELARVRAERDALREAFLKADFYIGCTIEDKELLAWKEYDEAKQRLCAAQPEDAA